MYFVFRELPEAVCVLINEYAAELALMQYLESNFPTIPRGFYHQTKSDMVVYRMCLDSPRMFNDTRFTDSMVSTLDEIFDLFARAIKKII